MGTRVIVRLAVLTAAVLAAVGAPASAAAAVPDLALPASGGPGDMLFVAGAGVVMLVAVGALAVAQSRGRDAAAGPESAPDPGDDPWV